VIGLPLLRALSVDEFEGALAHELAHFTVGDVRRRRIVNAALGRIHLMRSVLERGSLLLTWLNPLWWLLCGYGAFLRRAAGAIRRVQECRADIEAARVAGAETYGRALVRASVLSVGFRRMALGIVVRARRSGEPIDNFFVEFADAMRDLSADHRERIIRNALRKEASGTDEHPPLRRRLEILGIDGTPALDVADPLASTLVADLESIERELTPWAVRGLALGMGARLKRRLGFRRNPAAPRPDAVPDAPPLSSSSDA
jgi:Zn-dependent protease with chaperone function